MTQMTQKIGKTLLRTYACTYAQHFYCINPSNVSFRQTDSGTVTVGTVEITKVPRVRAHVRTTISYKTTVTTVPTVPIKRNTHIQMIQMFSENPTRTCAHIRTHNTFL